MLILTDKTIDTWDVPASKFSKLMADFVREKQGRAGPGTFVMVPAVLFSVFALVFGIGNKNWTLTLSGVGVIAACIGIIYLTGMLARPYIGALGNCLNAYLDTQPIDQVIHQAVSLGPGYLGRQYLLDYLDERNPDWSTQQLDVLVRLVRAEELPSNQASKLQWYLDENHPGWSVETQGSKTSI